MKKKPRSGNGNSAGSQEDNGSTIVAHGSSGGNRGSGDDGDEMSLSEFAVMAERKAEPDTGKAFDVKAAEGTTGGKDQAGGGMQSSMSDLLGGPKTLAEQQVDAKVSHREGDGLALKAIVARHVSKKVSGERSKLSRCVQNHGYPGSGDVLRATLHFSEQGTVGDVSISDGTPDLEGCFLAAFDGWRLSVVNKKIKIPIAVRFQ